MGEWSGDKYNGYGIYRNDAGNVFKGNFKDGNLHGKVVRTMLSGQIDEVTYEMGEVISVKNLRKEPDFGGIGISFNYNYSQKAFLIAGVGEDFPSDKAGLKVGDKILKIDGKAIATTDIKDVVPLLKGPAGSTVVLTIDRGGVVKDYRVTREKINAQKLGEQVNR